MKAVYVGAGHDLLPVIHCKHIKTFFYIDGLPYSAYGILQCGFNTSKGHDVYSRPDFVDKLDEIMTMNDFHLKKVISNLREYSNEDQTVFYLVNTAIPYHVEEIRSLINDFDVLFVAGHDPDCRILKATTKKITMIGCQGTSFYNEKDEHYGPENYNSVVYKLHNGDIEKYFNAFHFLHKNGEIKKYKSWNLFYDYFLQL